MLNITHTKHGCCDFEYYEGSMKKWSMLAGTNFLLSQQGVFKSDIIYISSNLQVIYQYL